MSDSFFIPASFAIIELSIDVKIAPKIPPTNPPTIKNRNHIPKIVRPKIRPSIANEISGNNTNKPDPLL